MSRIHTTVKYTFSLPIRKFCLFFGKMTLCFIAILYFFKIGCEYINQRSYKNAQQYLLKEYAGYQSLSLKHQLEEQEKQCDIELKSIQQTFIKNTHHTKRFSECMSKTNLTEHSYSATEQIQKKFGNCGLCTYKISGNLCDIDLLFQYIKDSQSGLFCKNILISKGNDSLYDIHLVFKEYTLLKNKNPSNLYNKLKG